MDSSDDRIVIENVNLPGSATRVSRAMYGVMKQAMWKVLPATAPGLAQSEIRDAVMPHLPQDLYPGGAKAGLVGQSGAIGSGGQGNPGA